MSFFCYNGKSSYYNYWFHFKFIMKKLNLFSIIVLLFILGINNAKAENEASNNGVACTMEAKLCPDGSSVSRTGLNCEFALCPDSLKKMDSNNLPLQTLQGDQGAKKEEIKQELEIEREKVSKDLEAERADLKIKMDALKASIKNEKNATKAKAKEDIISGREKALERFDKIVSNMSDLKDRINTQITYFKTKNIDTSGAEAFIATAETKLNDIKAKIVIVYSLFSNSLNELGTADKTTLQNTTKDIQDIVSEVRDILNNAVQSLKDSILNKK